VDRPADDDDYDDDDDDDRNFHESRLSQGGRGVELEGASHLTLNLRLAKMLCSTKPARILRIMRFSFVLDSSSFISVLSTFI
jgi:hypothetical protein